jgi:hypothetical protein
MDHRVHALVFSLNNDAKFRVRGRIVCRIRSAFNSLDIREDMSFS